VTPAAESLADDRIDALERRIAKIEDDLASLLRALDER
jgi:hypothetical protein